MYNKDGTVQTPYRHFFLDELEEALNEIGISYRYEDWSYQFYNETGDISLWIRTDKLYPFLEGFFAGLAQTIDKKKIENLFDVIDTQFKCRK